MSKNQQQNGLIPGGGGVNGADDFSDGESTPLTQDYGDRYVENVSLRSSHGICKRCLFSYFFTKREERTWFAFVLCAVRTALHSKINRKFRIVSDIVLRNTLAEFSRQMSDRI